MKFAYTVIGDPCTEDICDSSVAPGLNPCRTANVTCPAVSVSCFVLYLFPLLCNY